MTMQIFAFPLMMHQAMTITKIDFFSNNKHGLAFDGTNRSQHGEIRFFLEAYFNHFNKSRHQMRAAWS